MDVYLLYFGLGAVAGIVSGLFGLGGGVVIVPILIFSFAAQGFSAEILTHLAIGTSLATIVVTSVSSVLAHHKKGAVLWPVALWMAPGICVGAASGASVAVTVGGPALQLGFGLFMCTVSIQMGLSLQPAAGAEMPGKVGKTLVGTVIGFVSSLFGIGGGSLTVPYLSWVRTPMKNSVATAAACGFPIAASGAITYLLQGVSRPELPAGAWGFIYFPAFVGIIVASTIFAKLGAHMAHRLPDRQLKQGFALLLLVLGIRFVWINLMPVMVWS